MIDFQCLTDVVEQLGLTSLKDKGALTGFLNQSHVMRGHNERFVGAFLEKLFSAFDLKSSIAYRDNFIDHVAVEFKG